MKFKNLLSNKDSKIDGPLEIIPSIFSDKRGIFFESWNQIKFNKILSENINFVQDNQSQSKKNVLRGLHYQIEPKSQGKLVRVTNGRIYDVIVDLRKNSKTFGLWSGLEINSELNNQLWVPVGFAHGFITLSQKAEVLYKVDEIYFPDLEKTILWNDEQLSINWPISKEPLLSEKDKKGISFANFKSLL